MNTFLFSVHPSEGWGPVLSVAWTPAQVVWQAKRQAGVNGGC